jgi:hypothetical protein
VRLEASKSRPMSKGKALLISSSFSDDINTGPKVDRPTRANLIRPRLSGGGFLS